MKNINIITIVVILFIGINQTQLSSIKFFKKKITVIELSEIGEFLINEYTKSVTELIRQYFKTKQLKALKKILEDNDKYLLVDNSSKNYVIINANCYLEYVNIYTPKQRCRILKQSCSKEDLFKLSQILFENSQKERSYESFTGFLTKQEL